MKPDTGYEARVKERRQQGVALPLEDNETLETNLAFLTFLNEAQREEIKNIPDTLEKRRLIARYAKQFSHETD